MCPLTTGMSSKLCMTMLEKLREIFSDLTWMFRFHSGVRRWFLGFQRLASSSHLCNFPEETLLPPSPHFFVSFSPRIAPLLSSLITKGTVLFFTELSVLTSFMAAAAQEERSPLCDVWASEQTRDSAEKKCESVQIFCPSVDAWTQVADVWHQSSKA